jgi:hypothetical protein
MWRYFTAAIAPFTNFRANFPVANTAIPDLPANDRPYFSVMSILWSELNLPYWIILSRIRFSFLSVRRVQFHSLQIPSPQVEAKLQMMPHL